LYSSLRSSSFVHILSVKPAPVTAKGALPLAGTFS